MGDYLACSGKLVYNVITEGLLGVLGNKGKRIFFSRKQGINASKLLIIIVTIIIIKTY